MAGISSKALNFGNPVNKEQTFQGQRFDDELGVNYIQFKYRSHDPQIGRFIEIDPLSEDYEYNSTYAFSENKVTSHVELEGLEAVWADNNVERDVRDVSSGRISIAQLEERVAVRAGASKVFTVAVAVGGTIAAGIMLPGFAQTASIVMAAEIFGVPSPGAPTSMATTVMSETKAVAQEVKAFSTEQSSALSPNVKKVVNKIKEIKLEGGTVKSNPLKPNQEVNLTITKDGQKLDLRIETHPLSKNVGGDGNTPQRHMNVDIKPKVDLPNKGHKILE